MNNFFKSFLLVLSILFSSIGHAQIFTPVTWSFSSEKIQDNTYELQLKASIEKGWHLYAQNIEEGGPIPTTFTFKENPNTKLIGNVLEPKGHTEYDPNFDMQLTWFENNVIFTQKVSALNDTKLEGEVEFMVCDDEKCLPPEYVEFSFDLKAHPTTPAPNTSTTESPASSTKNPSPPATPTTSNQNNTTNNTPNPNQDPLKTTSSSTPTTSESRHSATEAPSTLKTDTKAPSSTQNTFEYNKVSVNLEAPLADCAIKSANVQKASIWGIFILGFLGGLLALLTPCVFPMIPLTVSFFTKDSKAKGLSNAFLYGFFILAVYLLLSIPFHLLDSIDPNILNTISTNIYLNLAFFVIFIFFSFSFFGYYEITLPSWLSNRADSASSSGGVIGIFFMAITLALVSFSCTGPILGSLLAGSLSSNGGAWQLTSGMAGFGLALALPFALFAAFPSWLNNLPKSGGWLSDVKVLLGFIEVALAFKFLSNADLVKHWKILPYELFLAIWILVCIGVLLYLFNILKFPHSSPFKKWGFARVLLVIFFGCSTLYLFSGYKYEDSTKTFSSLPLLSGLAPPAGYSYIHPNHCPLNLNCFHDYNEGLAYAKKVDKPIMLDFTGWACVNCRKMEENVWKDPAVFKLINEEYVLISLYVDDREKLPQELQHTYTTKQGKKKKIRTVGDQWATFQTETFNNNSQPWYPLLSPDEQLLISPVGNTPEIEKFKAYLQCGLTATKKENN